MDVFGANDEADDHHALGRLCPLLDHEESIDERWDRDASEAGRIEQQLGHALVAAMRDRAFHEIHPFDERT
jgi:hypothetical protein